VTKLKWFADNSELNGIKDADIPDILIFGGIAVTSNTESHLQVEIERIKARYASSRAPIKWNMKDLKTLYEQQNKLDMYESLLAGAKEWRLEIFSAISNTDATFILACIESYSPRRELIKLNKEQLTQHSFSNGLMRFGQHVGECHPETAMVVLDWPDKGKPQPFNSEYMSAFNFGKTQFSGIGYHCGALKQLRFADSALFSNMHHCTLLQAADLVVGATRELIECCIEKKESGQGVDCIRIAKNNFRGAPDKVVGRGLSVSTGNAKFKSQIESGFQKLVYS